MPHNHIINIRCTLLSMDISVTYRNCLYMDVYGQNGQIVYYLIRNYLCVSSVSMLQVRKLSQ